MIASLMSVITVPLEILLLPSLSKLTKDSMGSLLRMPLLILIPTAGFLSEELCQKSGWKMSLLGIFLAALTLLIDWGEAALREQLARTVYLIGLAICAVAALGISFVSKDRSYWQTRHFQYRFLADLIQRIGKSHRLRNRLHKSVNLFTQ
ncbi:MAG: hypothetical protein PVI11_04420 [Candidatus Aminicenantes bacterium]